MSHYYVYIIANSSRTLYIGMTNNLIRRIAEHKRGNIKGFASKYNIKKLVYFEEGDNVDMAISREKEIKAWRREKKIALIETMNPDWSDLSEDWFSIY